MFPALPNTVARYTSDEGNYTRDVVAYSQPGYALVDNGQGALVPAQELDGFVGVHRFGVLNIAPANPGANLIDEDGNVIPILAWGYDVDGDAIPMISNGFCLTAAPALLDDYDIIGTVRLPEHECEHCTARPPVTDEEIETGITEIEKYLKKKKNKGGDDEQASSD